MRGTLIASWVLLSGMAPPPESVAAPGDEAGFNQHVQAALSSLERSPDERIRRLYAAVLAAPVTIWIRPITDDRATWHRDGDRSRPHTEPAAQPANGGSRASRGPVVYLPPDAADPEGRRWQRGALVHELVHALDLANRRYHRDSMVRERRAVFMQNLWMDGLGYKLRSDYHGRFATLDYQDAKRRGATEELLRYVFTRSDFPAAPAMTATEPSDDRE